MDSVFEYFRGTPCFRIKDLPSSAKTTPTMTFCLFAACCVRASLALSWQRSLAVCHLHNRSRSDLCNKRPFQISHRKQLIGLPILHTVRGAKKGHWTQLSLLRMPSFYLQLLPHRPLDSVSAQPTGALSARRARKS